MTPLESSVHSILRQYSTYPAVVDALFQWTDNPTVWQEGMPIGDTYPHILDNLKARYSEKVATLALEKMKSEVAKLMVLANFNVQRVVSSIRDSSDIVLPVITSETLVRVDALKAGERVALYSFLILLKERDSFFATNVEDDPSETDDFRKLFARVRVAAPEISERRFINILQETGVMNRLLNIGKTNRFLVYVTSVAARKSLSEILKKLGSPAPVYALEPLKTAADIDKILSNLMEEGVVYAPNVSVPQSLKGIVSSYKGYVALSPLAVTTREIQEPEVKKLREIELITKDSSGNPLGLVDVKVDSSLERTDDSGRLILRADGISTIRLEKAGYRPRTLTLSTTESAEVRLEPITEGIHIGRRAELELEPQTFTPRPKLLDKELRFSESDFSPLTLILGAPGSGRTTIAKRILVSKQSSRLLVLDWKGEYTASNDFRVLSLKAASELLTFNLFDSGYWKMDESIRDTFVLSFLAEYFAQENRPLTEEQSRILRKAIQRTLQEVAPNIDRLISLLGDSEEAKKMGSFIKKSTALSRFFSPQVRFQIEDMTHTIVDLSGRGLHMQPKQSEKFLLGYLILKALALQNKQKVTIVIEELLGYAKTQDLKRDLEGIVQHLLDYGHEIIGIAREWPLNLNPATIFLHRGVSQKVLDQFKVAHHSTVLDKLPEGYSIVSSKPYSGLVYFRSIE